MESPRTPEDGALGIPNLGFEPYPQDQSTDIANNKTTGNERKGIRKYNFQQFFPCVSRNRQKAKVDDCGLFSLMFMSWITNTVIKGFKKPLQIEDLDELSPYESMEYNGRRIKRLWDSEVNKVGMKSASLGKVVWRAVRTRLIFVVLLYVLSQLLAFIAPALFVRYILEYLETKESSPVVYGISMVIGLLFTMLLRTFSLSLQFILNIRTGVRARSMVYSLLFEKLTKLRNIRDKSMGEFVNICASDAQRVYEAVILCKVLIGGPITIVIAIIYTTYFIGPAALVGSGLFLLVYPIQASVAKLAGKLRRRVAELTDDRVRLMSELLNHIKVIKMYAWEDSFEKAIIEKRRCERKALTKSSLLQGINMSIALILPTIAAVATFSVHIATGRNLSSSQAFTVMTIFNTLIYSLDVLPFGVRALAEAKVAVGRLKELLEMEELQPFLEKPDNPNVALLIEDANFSWDEIESEFDREEENLGADIANIVKDSGSVSGIGETKKDRKSVFERIQGSRHRSNSIFVTTNATLYDIDLKIEKGKLVGICGSIGSGKSSLLQCILAQMQKTRGRVAIGGSIAYVAQQAWIMNATARDNILLGLPFNEARYNSVRFACSLTTDFEMLPNGDRTEIGERGINLSGGQKQRISLARALYADKDLYLLDDPLSAVDAHVGQHIFQHLIKGALYGKTVLFATHQLQYLSQCDKVIYLKKGRIAERGSYNELMNDNEEFATLIRLFLQEVQEELEEHSVLTDDEDLANFLQRARSQSSWSTASADDVSEIINRRLSIINSPVDINNDVITEERLAPLRKRSRFGSTLEPFRRQTSTSSGFGSLLPAPEEDERRTFLEEEPVRVRRFGTTVEPFKPRTASTVTFFIGDDEGTKTSPVRRRSRFRSTLGNLKRRPSTVSAFDPDLSLASKRDETMECNEEAGKLTQSESRKEGSVGLSTYAKYIKASGGLVACVLVFLFFCLVLGIQAFIELWLSYWLDSSARKNITTTEKSGIRSDNPDNNYYIMVYCLGSVAFLLALFLKTYIFVKLTLKASSKLHDHVFAKVMRATMAFFDVTPTGQILNRFSKDLDEIDAQLPWTLESFTQNMLRIVISIGLVAVMFPWFLVAVVPLMIVFFVLNKYFRRSVRELKRLDGVTRSPIFTHLTATVQGLSTLHAFDKMKDFNEKFKVLVDRNSLPFFMHHCSIKWLSIRLDMITAIIATVTALLVVLTKGTLPAAFAGLSLSYAIRVTGRFRFTVRMVTETESRFISVERMTSYIDSAPIEAPIEIKETKPPKDWPHNGTIVFEEVQMRYRPGLPLVLNNVTGYIHSNEKIGIVGRTGSGKSSIGIALWRLVENVAGTTKIDDVDISTIGLHDLRSRISIIPQDPVLFIGTIRYNLDPLEMHTDEEIWTALERSHLKDTVINLPLKLLAPVVENGENFSVGERQLVCMARALLRNSKILMLDEATAAIDSETDAKIQDTIRESFSNCTLLIVAHRLNTVLSADRIIVMEEGKIIEFESPSVLSSDQDSQFSRLLQAAELQNVDCTVKRRTRSTMHQYIETVEELYDLEDNQRETNDVSESGSIMGKTEQNPDDVGQTNHSVKFPDDISNSVDDIGTDKQSSGTPSDGLETTDDVKENNTTQNDDSCEDTKL